MRVNVRVRFRVKVRGGVGRLGLEGSVFSSAAWKRRFSRRRSSPGASLAAAAATASPLHSLTLATALPSSSESRAAIGAVESLSTRFPLGLPTWEQSQ